MKKKGINILELASAAIFIGSLILDKIAGYVESKQIQQMIQEEVQFQLEEKEKKES